MERKGRETHQAFSLLRPLSLHHLELVPFAFDCHESDGEGEEAFVVVGEEEESILEVAGEDGRLRED